MATTTTVDTQSIVAGSGGTSTPVKLTLQSGTQAVSIQLGITTTRAAVATDQSGGRREFTLYWAFSPDDLTLANVPTLLRHCAKSQSMVMNTDIETAGQRQQVRDKVNGQYLYVWFGYPGSLDAYAVVIKATELFFLSSATDPTFTTITVTGSTSTPIVTSPAASPLTLGTGTSGAAITVLSASNNVGVGVIAPAYLLELQRTLAGSASAVTSMLSLNALGSGNTVKIRLTDNVTSDAYITHTGAGAAANQLLGFGINGVQAVVLNGAGNFLIGTTDATGLTGAGGLKINSSTAGSAGAGALVIEGGLAAAGASYFGGAVTAMISGTRTSINDDSVATFTPLVIGGASRGFFVILNSDYSQSIIGGYFSSGGNYLLYTIVKSADVTTTNTTTMTGTTGTDGKMNIGFNNGIIYIENRLGGSGNFLYLPFGGTN